MSCVWVNFCQRQYKAFFLLLFNLWVLIFSLSSPNKEQKKSKTWNMDEDQKGIYMKEAWKLEFHVNFKAQKPSHAQHVGEIWLALHSSIISLSITSLTQKAQISSFQFSIKGEVWGDEPYHDTFVHENQMHSLKKVIEQCKSNKATGRKNTKKGWLCPLSESRDKVKAIRFTGCDWASIVLWEYNLPPEILILSGESCC